MITIIIPVFNCLEYLEECISSVLAQSVEDLQVILIDDGSNDGSELICDYYKENDCRIEVFHIPNSGVSTARNIGLQHAKGEWVTFIDADDYVSRDYCKNMLDAVSPEIDMVIARTISFNNKGFLDDGFNLSSDTVYDEDKSVLYKSIFVDNFKGDVVPHVSTCSAKLIRKSLIDEYRIRYKVDMKLYEDAIFNIEIINQSRKVVVIDKKIYYYRLNWNSSSNSLHQLSQIVHVYETLKEYDEKFHFKYHDYEYYFKVKNLNMIFINASNCNTLSCAFIKKCCYDEVYN